MSARGGQERGFTLIIVVFMIMLIGGLGWSLAMISSTGFDASLRLFNSEKAMYAALSGQNWAMNMLAENGTWRTDNGDNNCTVAADWLTHSLPGAQYQVCCRNSVDTEQADGDVAVETKGYTPSVAGFISSRQLKLVLRTGQFTKVIQAKGIFDWSQVIPTGHASNRFSTFNGDIQASYYKGDNDAIYNEDPADLHSGTLPIVPTAGGNTIRARVIAAEPFPAIDMPYYESRAAMYGWSWKPRLSAKIVSVASGTRTELVLDSTIFSDSGWGSAPDAVIRNITRGHCEADTWRPLYSKISSNRIALDDSAAPVDWVAGDRIVVAPRPTSITYDRWDGEYTLTFPVAAFSSSNDRYQVMRRLVYGTTKTVGSWDNTDWGIITYVSSSGKTVRVQNDEFAWLADTDVRRWDKSPCWLGAAALVDWDVYNDTLWYIMSDLIVDCRYDSVRFDRTGLVVEGDVVIKGANEAYFSKRPLEYPNMATKNGDIISVDTPSGTWPENKLTRRNFDDFIYTENGDVTFNYIDAKGIYGRNIYLTGMVMVAFDASAVSKMSGYAFGLGGIKWQEQ